MKEVVGWEEDGTQAAGGGGCFGGEGEGGQCECLARC